MKVVINVCYGGFNLSPRAVKRLAELNGRECYFFDSKKTSLSDKEAFSAPHFLIYAFDVPYYPPDKQWKKHYLDSRPENRADPKLVQVVEELGDAASASLARLKIVEIPDSVTFDIEEYDGMEHIAERHRTWY